MLWGDFVNTAAEKKKAHMDGFLHEVMNACTARHSTWHDHALTELDSFSRRNSTHADASTIIREIYPPSGAAGCPSILFQCAAQTARPLKTEAVG